jgi:hypothetical protein
MSQHNSAHSLTEDGCVTEARVQFHLGHIFLSFALFFCCQAHPCSHMQHSQRVSETAQTQDEMLSLPDQPKLTASQEGVFVQSAAADTSELS